MKKISFVVLIAAISIFVFLPRNNYAANELGEEIRLYLGQTKILTVNHPSRVVVGNPEVADIANVSLNEIILTPKGIGSTTLVFWDSFGEQFYRIKVFTENMHEIKGRIDNILARLDLPKLYTKEVDEEGKVLLLGSVETQADRERALTAVNVLKDKIVDLIEVKELETMVDIDVQVIELDKGLTSTLGFTWPGSVSLTDVSIPTTTAVTGLSNVFHLSKFTRSAFNIAFDALVQEGKARILSRPRLACQSGKEAELLVGGEKPVFTTTVAATTGASGTQVEYKEYGIKLKIKPFVTEEDRVKLALNVEVSEVGDAEIIGAVNSPTAKAYPLTKRSTSTELYLNDGQTMAISGLIKDKTIEEIRKTPFLGDLPIVGGAFRKKTTTAGGGVGQRDNTELFIMLTPTIVNNKKDVPAKKITPEPVNIPALIDQQIMPGPLHDYMVVVQRRILDNLTYPADAKAAGFQGSLKLSLHLSYLGKLLDVGVKNSSGYKVFDDNAVAAARAIAYYPPFPAALESQELWIDIPVDYRLN